MILDFTGEVIYWEIWMCYPREALQPLAESLAFKNIRLILF